MANLLSNLKRLFKVSFVFHTVGDIFLNISNVAQIVRQYVYGEAETKGTTDVTTFIAEASTLLYLNPEVVMSKEHQFQQFHDFTIEKGIPMATILITTRKECRNCGKQLLLDKNSHPVIVYHTSLGSYMGSRFIRQCRRCQIYEHYGYWTSEGQKHYDESTLQLPFLLSTEDTAFDMTLLKECSSLLVVGAVPFSTFTTAYNRRFGYASVIHKQDIPNSKRMKR